MRAASGWIRRRALRERCAGRASGEPAGRGSQASIHLLTKKVTVMGGSKGIRVRIGLPNLPKTKPSRVINRQLD